MQKQRALAQWGILGILSGVVATGLLYLGLRLPLGLFLLTFPTLFAALQWGRRGGGAAALLLFGGALLAGLTQPGNWGAVLLAGVVLLAVGLWVGQLVEAQQRQQQLLLTTRAEADARYARRLQELDTLQQLTRLVGESLELGETLQAVLQTLQQLIPYDNGEITLWDPVEEVMRRGALLAHDETRSCLEQAGQTYRLDEGLTGWLAQHRQPLLIRDVRESAVRPKVDRPEAPTRAYLGIPLLTRGELVGTLEVDAEQPGRFSAHDMELVQAFGAHAAIAIEKARLYLGAQERVQVLERVRDITGAAGRAQDLTELLTEVVGRVAGMLEAQVVGVLIYDAAQQALVARAPFHGLPDTWLDNYRVPLPEKSARARRWKEIPYWIVENAQSDPDVEAWGLQTLAVAAELQQLLFVPLEAGGERIGFIQVANPQSGRRFTEEDARLLEMVASQISGMIHVSQLLERVEQRTRLMESLVTVASTVGGSLDLDTVLETIVQAVSGVLKCQRTAIFVLDPGTHLLNLVAAEGVSPQYRQLSQNIPVVEGGRAHAIAVNEVIISEDVQKQPELSAVAPLAGSEGFRAYADVPLHRGETAVGLLSAQFSEPHPFSEDEIIFLRILAEQAAVAIENARLYTQTDAELQRRLQSLEVLQRVTQASTATFDLDYILKLVLDETIRFTAADAGFVVLWNIGDPHAELRALQGYTELQAETLTELVEQPTRFAPFQEFVAQQATYYQPDLAPLPEIAAQGLAIRSLAIVPVFYEQRLAAAIAIHSSRPQAFTKIMLEFQEGLSVQTAIAVGNFQRYHEQLARGELMRQRAEQMALLLEVTRTMRSDQPLDDVLLDVSYAIQEGSGYNIVLISVLDSGYQRRIAGAGIPLADLERMKQVRQPWTRVERLFQERFSLGRCYYIPAEYRHLTSDLDVFELAETRADLGRAPGAWHGQDMLLIPLYSTQGEILGMMSVDDPRDGRAPTRTSVEVLELFSAQVALAIENSQLVQNLRLQLNTLQLFNELSRSITTKLDLSLVLNTVAQAVTNLLGYDYSTIFLQERETRRFMPMASSGYGLELLGEITFKVGEGLVGTVAQTGMPLVLENASTDPRFISGPLTIGASIMVPLTVEGRPVGVLTADRKQPGDFEPKDVATFTALADQVAVAVENARLFEEVTRFSQQLEQRVEERTRELGAALSSLQLERDRTSLLYRIASELVASLDIDRVLDKALGMLRDAVKADRGSILLLDINNGQLMYRAAIGKEAPLPPGGTPARFGRNEGLVGWILKKRKPVIIPDVTQDERWLPGDSTTVTRSVLAVPILGSGGEGQGAIFLQSASENYFDEDAARLVEAAAVQLGNALNNAELYRLIREQAERLGMMLRTQQIEAVKNQAILEGIADGVMVADANGRIILFNAAAERIFALRRTQALGQFLDEMLGLYGTKAREWLQQVQEWRRDPETYEAGLFMSERLEMNNRIVSVHISPVISQGNEFLGVVSVFRDITPEVEAERAKNEFVSTVSHELRTPMTSVKGYADLLLMGAAGSLSELQRNFLSIIKSNADRLSTLVNDLLDLSRIETGKVQLQMKPVAMETLVEQVVMTMLPKAEEKEIRLSYVTPPALPKVYGDPDRLTQILTNLVGNAYKYTPTGGSVCIYVYVREGMMQVGVADTGIGISQEDQAKIFERFFRVDDPLVHEVSGTGLGLSITVSLVRMHGGDIKVESELGEGSIFTFSVPLMEGEATADVGEPPEGFAAAAFTVLVVEDDPEIAQLLKVTLESEGRRVLVANSGEVALRLARQHHPDLISLDIKLPDLDGFEVLQLLKREADTADIPVVIVSVVPDPDRGLRLGAIDYITKPVDTEHILEVVDKVLAKQGLVLIVDDDRDTLAFMREALRARGLGVRTTGQGERALRLARELHPALIVLDLKLPGMDGHQVLEKLKQDTRTADIPVIIMTGSVTDAEGKEQELKALGALRFLTKPFSIEELADEISHLIDGQDPNKE